MNRQALILIVIVIISVLVGSYILLVRVFPTPTRNADETQREQETTENPVLGNNLSRLHTASILAPTLLADGATVRAYEAITGHVRDIDLVGVKPVETTSTADVSDLQAIWWSPNNSTVITLREDAEGPQWTLFDYKTRIAQSLDSATTDVSFSADSQRFAYAIQSTENNAVLYTASVGGNGVERIADIPDPRPLLWWINNDTILASQRPTGAALSSVWTISIPQKTTALLSDTAEGIDLLPSPDGSQLLQTRGTALIVSNNNLQNQKALGIETVVQKCRWIDDNTTAICAVPNDFTAPKDDILPDSYHWGGVLTEDTFVVINTSSGRVLRTIDPSFPIDAINLLVPPPHDQIIFLNRRDGMLYQLRVPGGF